MADTNEPTNESPPEEELPQSLFDEHGRLPEPDGQMLLLRRADDETIWALMPSGQYVRRRMVRYRKIALAATLLAALGCFVHWLVVRPAKIDDYVIFTACAALVVLLALKVWNSAIRAGIVLRVGRRLQFKIATLKIKVHPMLGERLGLRRSADGRFWEVYRVDPANRFLKFKLAFDAFPTLPEFLADKAPGLCETIRGD